MKTVIALVSVGLIAIASSSRSEEPDNKKDGSPTKATYLIMGLHCPPCTRTVESSLKRVKGVQSVKVDWNTKNAQIEFDEKLLPAQALSAQIAATPHMMGSSMHYAGWLSLKVPDVKNEASAEKAKKALAELKGIKQVVAYPKQQSIGVQFTESGKLSSHDLIDALDKAGLKATN
jgi:copper chaperone CopZ